MVELGGFLGRFFAPLLKTDLPLMENIHKPLAKSILIPLRVKPAVSETDPAIQKKKIFGSHTKTLIFSNEELNDIMEVVNSLNNPVFLIKSISETVENEVKEQNDFMIC